MRRWYKKLAEALEKAGDNPVLGFCEEAAFYTAPHRKRVVATRVARQGIDNGRVTVFTGMLLNGMDVAMISRDSKAPDFVEFLGGVDPGQRQDTSRQAYPEGG